MIFGEAPKRPLNTTIQRCISNVHSPQAPTCLGFSKTVVELGLTSSPLCFAKYLLCEMKLYKRQELGCGLYHAKIVLEPSSDVSTPLPYRDRSDTRPVVPVSRRRVARSDLATTGSSRPPGSLRSRIVTADGQTRHTGHCCGLPSSPSVGRGEPRSGARNFCSP
jgi:hypothetical protein